MPRPGRASRRPAGGPGPLRHLTTYFPANGVSDLTFSIFLADGATYVGEPTDPSESERIELGAHRQAAQRPRLGAGQRRDGHHLPEPGPRPRSPRRSPRGASGRHHPPLRRAHPHRRADRPVLVIGAGQQAVSSMEAWRAGSGSRRLGCPKNQVDSDKLVGTLLADGMDPAASADRGRPRRRQHLRLHRGGPPGVDRHRPRPERRPARRRPARGHRLHGRALRRRAGRGPRRRGVLLGGRGGGLRRARSPSGASRAGVALAARRRRRRPVVRPAQPAPPARRRCRGPT